MLECASFEIFAVVMCACALQWRVNCCPRCSREFPHEKSIGVNRQVWPCLGEESE